MPAHKTTVTEKPRSTAGAFDVTCPCSWGSYGHATRQAATAHGQQHEAERNR